MKKLNNKGIAISSILYTLLVLLLALIFGVMGIVLSGKSTFDTLKNDVINKLNNVVVSREKTLIGFTNDLLLKSNTYTYMDGTYLKGQQDSNYVWYSGNLYRIMGKDANENIRLISENSITAISFSRYDESTTFASSHLKAWLNDYFYDHLADTSILQNTSYCNDTATVASSSRETCESSSEDLKVTTISLDEYRLSLEPKTYACNDIGLTFYQTTPDLTMNDFLEYLSDNNQTCIDYVKNKMINMNYVIPSYNETANEVTFSDSYINDINIVPYWTLTLHDIRENCWSIASVSSSDYSETDSPSGVRPIITLSSSVAIKGGDGTEASPLIIEDMDSKTGKLIDNATSGEYIMLEGKRYRVVETISETGTKIVLDDYLDTDTYTDMITKMSNNTYLSDLGLTTTDSRLVSYTWDRGNFVDFPDSYTVALSPSSNTFTSYIGGIRMGEMYSAQINSFKKSLLKKFWLMTPESSTSAWNMLYVNISLTQFATDTYNIRPALVISQNVTISKGNGTLESPYEI